MARVRTDREMLTRLEGGEPTLEDRDFDGDELAGVAGVRADVEAAGQPGKSSAEPAARFEALGLSVQRRADGRCTIGVEMELGPDEAGPGAEGALPRTKGAPAGVKLAARRVPSPVPGRKVTYRFGIRNPRYKIGYHTGDDYAGPKGAPVVAVRNGTIAWSNDKGGAYGKWIGLRADNGRVYVYAHLSVRSVRAGQKVKAGQRIGKVGATGKVTGPHLHFEDHPPGGFKYGRGRKPRW
jgi:murein DD-endopeptidase MepM/ murein hydrolase activator NlpD